MLSEGLPSVSTGWMGCQASWLICNQCGKHAQEKTEADVEEMAISLVKLRNFEYIPGRSHKNISKFPSRSIAEYRSICTNGIAGSLHKRSGLQWKCSKPILMVPKCAGAVTPSG